MEFKIVITDEQMNALIRPRIISAVNRLADESINKYLFEFTDVVNKSIMEHLNKNFGKDMIVSAIGKAVQDIITDKLKDYDPSI